MVKPASPRGVVAVACLALAAVVSAVSSLYVALPDIARATGADLTQLNWIVDAYALTFAALLLPAGAIGDRYGRRRALIAGLVLFTLTAASAFMIGSPNGLIAVRAVLGLAAALIMPCTLSTITATMSGRERSAGIAVWTGVAGAGAILGLFASGLVLEWFSWRWVFGFSAVLGAVAALGAVAIVPESADPEHSSRDPWGALISAAGMGLLVYSLIEAPSYGWTAVRTWGGIAGGIALLAIFLAYESTRSRPLIDPRHFRTPAFSAGMLSVTLQFFTFFGFIFLLLQFLQLVLGHSPLAAAVRMLPVPLGLVPAARLSPRLLPRLGQARLCGAGLVLLAVAMYGVAQVDATTGYAWLGLLLWCGGIGMGLAMTPATGAITGSLPRAEQGVASAMNDLSREFGGALGIAVLTSVTTSSYQHALHLPAQVPDAMRHLARNSLAAAVQMPDPIQHLARNAYVTGMHSALRVSAIAVLLGALVVIVLLARAPREPASERHASSQPEHAGHPTP